MGEGLSEIIDIGIGFIVKQHHRLILGNDSDGSHQLLELVVKYPLVAGQVNLLASFDIFQQLSATNALAMSQTLAVLSGSALDVLHVLDAKLAGINVVVLLKISV